MCALLQATCGGDLVDVKKVSALRQRTIWQQQQQQRARRCTARSRRVAQSSPLPIRQDEPRNTKWSTVHVREAVELDSSKRLSSFWLRFEPVTSRLPSASVTYWRAPAQLTTRGVIKANKKERTQSENIANERSEAHGERKGA